jgi:hypothetical protein
MLRQTKIYFRESSVHGLPYLVNPQIHWIEKIFWTLMLIVSGICCGALIFKIGVKVQEDSMVTYTSDTAIDVAQEVLNYSYLIREGT